MSEWGSTIVLWLFVVFLGITFGATGVVGRGVLRGGAG
jgi:hypothetical protein